MAYATSKVVPMRRITGSTRRYAQGIGEEDCPASAIVFRRRTMFLRPRSAQAEYFGPRIQRATDRYQRHQRRLSRSGEILLRSDPYLTCTGTEATRCPARAKATAISDSIS